MPVVGPPIPLVGIGSTTVLELIEETKRLVYGASRQQLNRLQSSVLASAPTLILEFDLQAAVRGSMIAIENELCFVLDAVPASKTLTVIRGYLGTEQVDHEAGVVVEINPRFPRPYIKRALQQEIDSWGTRLFKVTPLNISFDSSSRIYDLGVADFIGVVDVRVTPYTGRTTWSNPTRWTVLRDMDDTVFASGAAIEFLGSYPTSGTARVKVAQKFDVSTWEDDTVIEGLGLATSMTDIPPYGAAWRLMSAKEVGRTDLTSQSEPRRSEEVPAGHIASVAAQLKKLRDDRIEEERWTLMNRYPLKGVA